LEHSVYFNNLLIHQELSHLTIYHSLPSSNHLIREKLLKDTVLTDIQKLVKQIDKDQYLNKLEAQSKKTKQSIQKQLEKLEKQLEIIKGRKRKYINMLAEEIITQEEYREM
jgi:site-specific DNA recombinase